MDYFQGVVTDFLRAKRTRFVNTEYMINLDEGEVYKKGRHWYCDAVSIDFEDMTVHLCEITYAKTLQSLSGRLQAWCTNWPEIVTAVRRDSKLKGDWAFLPRVFVPEDLKNQLARRISTLSFPLDCTSPMPTPMVTSLEDILPWKYRSWNGLPYVTSDA